MNNPGPSEKSWLKVESAFRELETTVPVMIIVYVISVKF